MKKYYGIEKDGQLGITVDNKVVEAKGKLSDGKAYVAYDVVRDYINSRFYWDSNENVLLYMLPKDMISVDVGSKDYSVFREKERRLRHFKNRRKHSIYRVGFCPAVHQY